MRPWDDEYTERYVQVTAIFDGYQVARDRAEYVVERLNVMTGLPHQVMELDGAYLVVPKDDETQYRQQALQV